MTAPVNTDLPTSNLVPGVYVQIQSQGGAALDDANRRVLILGTRLSSGTGSADVPARYTSQADVDADHGRGSEVARNFAAFTAQHGPGWADTWVCGVDEPSGGTAAARKIIVAGTATEAGYVDVYVAGYKVTVGIASGDAAATVAQAIIDQLNLLLDSPLATSTLSTATVVITYRHKGLTGNDLPIRVDQFDASGLTFAAGTLTVANSAGASGSLAIAIGATTYSVSITNGDANTVTATGINTAISAVSGPVTSSVNSGVVTLFYRTGRYVRRIKATLTSVTTQTVTSSDTAGAGVPTMTTALANISALPYGFAAWVNPFTDPDGATASVLDSIYDTILVDTNGVNQKPGLVWFGSAAKLATAGAQITVASPALTTTSPLARFSAVWCRESAVQAFEVASRCAAEYLWSDYFAQNLDGKPLLTRGSVPLLAPATVDLPSAADINSSMVSYYMTPVSIDAQGQIVIVRAMTTSNASNQDLREVSTIRQIDTARQSLRSYLVGLFSGKSYRTSTPKTPNTVTTRSVKDAIYVWALSLDDQDLFDDAPKWKDAIAVNVNAINNTRFDAFVPLAIIRNLHQLGVVLTPQ